MRDDIDALLPAAQAGDAAACSALLKSMRKHIDFWVGYHAPQYGLLSIQELTQEARIATLYCLRSFDATKGGFITWARWAARTRWKTAMQAAAREQHEETETVFDDGDRREISAMVDNSQSVDSRIEDLEEVAAFNALVARLTDAQAAVIEGLREGKDYATLASELGMTRQGVHITGKRALQKMKKIHEGTWNRTT
jgi:RNA polymerase sigma factor (sigma-70 family)